MGKTAKIIDEFTDLPVSRQRKHQLRNPEWAKKQREKWSKSEKGKAYAKAYMKAWHEKKKAKEEAS